MNSAYRHLFKWVSATCPVKCVFSTTLSLTVFQHWWLTSAGGGAAGQSDRRRLQFCLWRVGRFAHLNQGQEPEPVVLLHTALLSGTSYPLLSTEHVTAPPVQKPLTKGPPPLLFHSHENKTGTFYFSGS